MLLGVVDKPPGRGRKIGAKRPFSENVVFRLTRGLISEKVVLATGNEFPGFDRHHGPPLAGFAVSGFR
jgi:hypothetical protein